MNNDLNNIRNILNSHPVSALFNTSLIHSEPGNIVLNLKCKDGLGSNANPGGTFGCIVDCVARIASYKHIGDSFMSEYELNFHAQIPTREFVAYAVVDSANNDSAVYSCGIYAVENPENRLVAESQGTLLRTSN